MATKARIFFSKGRVKFDQAHVVKHVGAPSRAAAPTLDLRLIHKLITHRVRAAAGRGFRGSRRSGGYKLGHWGVGGRVWSCQLGRALLGLCALQHTRAPCIGQA